MVLTYWLHDYDNEKNNGLSFYHSKILKIYIILKNNYVCVDIMKIK